jgi:tetratricopeptide (TPR) repeat protein
VKAARQFACRGQFDQAREELATADRLQPGRKSDYDMLARKAVLETKAGNLKAARPFIEQALEVIAEPTALWLVMTIEAIRFDLPNKETWLYEKRWQDALKRRCRGETASLMCQMLNAHLLTPPPYESCDEHVQFLLKYVRRCSRVKWQVEDLRNVCDFLDTAKEYSLLEKLVKRGLRSFPRAAYLHWFAAQAEIAKGPRRCDRNGALDHLQEAVRLGTSSGDPRDKDVVDAVKQAQTFLSDVSLGDDDDDDDYDDEGNFDDLMDDLKGIPRNVILGMIQGHCKQMGLDPEVVMGEIERRQAASSRRTRGTK